MSRTVGPGVREIPLLSYQITVGRGLLARLGEFVSASGATRFALITDTTVANFHGAATERALGSACHMFTIRSGEAQKTRDTWARLTDEMISAGFARDACVVALGGGVVGDLAGFVAATYMRGIPVIQVPTSLLAMIDASIGGKTGVDTPAGKNLVGAFHQPAAVIVDPDLLATLPLQHVRAGLAEAIKHGVIRDASYFESLASYLGSHDLADVDRDWLADVVTRGIEIKAGVVANDEREHGLRKTLNFGHTIGHAVELLSDYRMLHGEAIAVGMAAEADIAEHMRIARRGTAAAIRHVLASAGLPTRRPTEFPVADIIRATRSDKKSRAGRVEYALPARVGQMAAGDGGWAVPVSDEIVTQVLNAVA